MKQLLIISLILILSINLSAQSISFNDLINLRSKSYNEIDKFLKARGWYFVEKVSRSTYTKYQWNYNKSKIGVFSFIETTDNNNTVTFKTNSNECYNELSKLIKDGEYKHIEQYENNGIVTNFYEYNGFVVEVSKINGVLTNNQTLYTFSYARKKTYIMLKEFR